MSVISNHSPAGTASEQEPLTPSHIFETINAYQQSAALCSAIELDVFTAIAEGADTAPAIATRCQAAERGIRILCDYLVIRGFLYKKGLVYSLTAESALFLNRQSPAWIGSVTQFLRSPSSLEGFQNLTEAVRQGRTWMSGEGSMDDEHPMWVDFARGMMPMMMPAAEEIADLLNADKAGKCRVLDLAAGHGIFGITIARRNPEAEVVAVDWKNVLTVARENAERFGVADRYHLLPGSAFDVEYGDGYDLVLFTNFFHHFDQATCEKLIGRAYAALKPGGRAVTLEFVPNEDRVSPPVSAAFALVMLGSTVAGDAYPFAEYDQMFRRGGFLQNDLHQLTMSPQQVIVSRR